MKNHTFGPFAIRCGVLAALVLFSGFLAAQDASRKKRHNSDRDKLIGAWHLTGIDSPGTDGKPVSVALPLGMLIYTRDGHMAVQLLYPKSAKALSNEYALNGYEASFGSFDVNEATHTLTHHIQGANTGDMLVGKDLPRIYQFTPDGHLVIRPANLEEHWAVTWEHY